MQQVAKGNLRRHALMILFAFSMIPLITLFGATYVIIDRVLQDKVDAVIEQSVNNLSLVLSGHLQSLVDMTLFSARNDDLSGVMLRELVSGDPQPGFFDLARIMKEREILARIPSPYQYMAIRSGNGPVFGSIRSYENLSETPFAESALIRRMFDRLTPSHSQEVMLLSGENLALEMGPDQIYAAANILSDGENAGVLMMGIDRRFFMRLLDHSRLNQETSLFILDSRGMLISAGARNHLEVESLPAHIRTFSGKASEKDAFVLHGRGFRTLRVPLRIKGIHPDLLLVLAAPKDSLYAEKSQFVLITVLLALCNLAGIALMAFVLQRSLIRPILALHKKVSAVRTGNLDTLIGPLPANELGQLGEGLQRMTGDLQHYIEEIRKREADRREMEIGLLQSQIKPHFVRNALNTIRWMADMKGAEGIGKAIRSLSLLMEYNFRNSDLLVSVRDELAYTREYVYLQRIRFQNKFEWTESVPEAILDCLILRLSFQPIVENAIAHGLSRKRDGGHLTLSGQVKDQQLLFSIADDGIGMSEASLREIMAQTPKRPEETNGERIAIANIRQRLQMHYGGSADLLLNSVEGVGTTVQLVFPLEFAKEERTDEHPAG